MREIMRKGIVTLMGVGTVVLAQGVTFPTTPTQTPINGMGLLAVFGAVLLYKTFTKKQLLRINENRVYIFTNIIPDP